MTAWWQGLSARERILLGVMAALVGAVFYWEGLLRPLRAAADNAARAHAAAAADLHRIEAAQSYLASQRAAPAGAGGTLRSHLRDAGANGLTLARIQPEPDGAITVWFEPAPAPLLFGWIGQLAQERGVVVSRLAVEQAEEGRVRAQATFAARGS